MDRLRSSVDLLQRLIAYPTISADSNLAMIDDLADRLSDCGARIKLFHDETGKKANLFATLGPDRQGGLVLSGHTDVVPVADQDWTSNPFAMHQRDTRLFGRGACDMKGFIAAAVAMAPEFAQLNLTRPLHFAFTYDEEVGCLGGQALVAALKAHDIRPDMVLIGEPTNMRVIEGHKGCCEYTIRISGQEGHGSAPHRGVNAAEYAARYVGKLLQLRADLMARAPVGGRFDPPWTTLNVGRISGGVAHNVIAGKAEIEWEMRPVQDADLRFVKETLTAFVEQELLPQMRAICPEADISTQVIGEIVGLTPMDDNAARDLVAGLLGVSEADLVAFGTEAGLFQTLGASVIVCGPGSIDQAHKPDEYIDISQMQACVTMLERLGHSSMMSSDQDAAFSKS